MMGLTKFKWSVAVLQSELSLHAIIVSWQVYYIKSELWCHVARVSRVSGEIKRMRKQCVPGAPPFFARAGDEARFVTKMYLWCAKAPQLSTSCWRYLTGKLKESITRVSLVPRPSQSPVLVAWSMQKWRGEAWYHLSRKWRRVYLGRQRGEGSPIERTHFVHAFFVLNHRTLFASPTFETPGVGAETTKLGL